MTGGIRYISQEESADGVKFSIYRYSKKRMTTKSMPSPDGQTFQYLVEPSDISQLKIELSNGSATLEPGALQYMFGNIHSQVVQHEEGRGFFSRAIASAGTGEAAHGTSYSGRGTIWCEPSSRQFILGTMDGDQDALLLDDKAFYACSSGISLSTHKHTTVSGILSGNGLVQPKISGRGVFAVECPVSVEEVEEVEVKDGEEVVVDGDFVLMYSASLTVTIGTLVKGLRNALRSGEGIVYRFRGHGKVWVMPTAKFPTHSQ